MPRLRTETLASHHDAVWAALADALEALLAERAYEAIRFGDIAAGTGIARNTLYNYAPDKTALLVRAGEIAARPLFDAVARELAQAEGARAQLSAVIATTLSWIATGPHRHLVIESLAVGRGGQGAGEEGSLEQRMLDLVAGLLRDGRAGGVFAADPAPDLTVAFMAGAILPAVRAVARRPQDHARIAARLTDFVLEGIAAP